MIRTNKFIVKASDIPLHSRQNQLWHSSHWMQKSSSFTSFSHVEHEVSQVLL